MPQPVRGGKGPPDHVSQEMRDRSLEILCMDFVLQSAKKQPLSQQLEVSIPHRYYALVKS